MVSLPPPSDKLRMQDHIFISYSSLDRAFIDRLAQDLRERGHICWIDFEGIQGGDRWRQSIADGLHPSRVVLLVLTPKSVASPWVNEEIRTALERDKKVIPLLLRPTAASDIPAAHTALAEVYAEIQYIKFTEAYNLERLLQDLPEAEAGIPGHCQRIVAQLAAAPWGLDHYIQSDAKALPLDASPYEDGIIKQQRENLLHTLWNSQRLIVLGEPGIGKSVALERLAWELATADPLRVPVRVKLLTYDGRPLLEWLRLDLVHTGEIKIPSMDETRAFLNDPPFDCYFLLDGLNEVRPEHRATIISEITALAMEFPRHQLVVTSRIEDESWRELRNAGAITDSVVVQTIRPTQAQTYLEAHLEMGDGRVLWRQLDADERMRGLALTPLLLWLIKEAWLEAKENPQDNNIRMPDNRGELYEQFVNRMMDRDSAKTRLKTSISREQQMSALEDLAMAFHRDRAVSMKRRQALKHVDEVTLGALLAGSLLTGDRIIRFAPHQTIQEYFAACANLPDISGILQNADDPWWAETFIQLAGIVDNPNALALQVAEINPWLAWWCVQEGQDVDSQTQDTIEAKSIALIDSDRVGDRRRAAQALAELQNNRIVEPLSRLLRDSDDETGEIAGEAIQRYGDAAVPYLLPYIGDNRVPSIGRARVGRTLGKIGDPRPGVSLNRDGLPDIAWCKIPAGPIQMGGDPDAWNAWEGALINLDYDFWVSQYPVTYAQYEAFVKSDGYRNRDYWTDAGWRWKGDRTHPELYWQDPRWHIANHPVVGVTWYEAYAFTRWLNVRRQALRQPPVAELAGAWEIRLLTESEWEKAARYPDGRKYPWGDVFDSNKANVAETSIGRTSAVGIFPDGASQKGIHDLSGNVWEWCLSAWADSYTFQENNDPEGTPRRVLRGGSWLNLRPYARAASRYVYSLSPLYRYYFVGVRAGVASPILR